MINSVLVFFFFSLDNRIDHPNEEKEEEEEENSDLHV